MPWLLLATTIFGINLGFWLLVGVLRFSSSHIASLGRGIRRRLWPGASWRRAQESGHGFRRDLIAGDPQAVPVSDADRITLDDIAALVPAHNEDVGIADTLAALARAMPVGNIYVVSDGSTDLTPEIVRDFGIHVLELWPNRGKAGALVAAIEHFDLRGRYKALVIVDADTELDEHYVERALPLINQPGIVAIAGHAKNRWRHHLLPRLSMFYTAYRVRLYRTLQFTLRYSQTWRYTNVTVIIPGFASMYRTSVLDKLEIDAKGLVIEDFNMTFELQKKRLGRIGYSPGISAISHDPDNLRDYAKQVARWNLGLLQTVRRQGVWPSFFWVAFGVYLVELTVSAFFFLAAPFLLAIGLLFDSPDLPVPFLSTNIPLAGFAASVFLLDYALTVLVAAYDRRPLLLVYGLAFYVLRYIDSVLFLLAIPKSITTRSDGRWASPRRYRYDATPAVAMASTSDAALAEFEAPDPLPTRAARYAMNGFSAVAMVVGVSVIVFAVSVLISSASATDTTQPQPSGPIRTGVVNTPPVVRPSASEEGPPPSEVDAESPPVAERSGS